MREEETNSEVAAAQKRKEERLQIGEHFRKKAEEFIKKVSELHKEVQDKTRDKTSVLMDEILHSIFFLGKIHDPPVPPELILDNEVLKSHYRQSFKLCSSQLPRRSPFSCVLDMMVRLVGQENEEEIKRRLQQFINEVESSYPPKRSHRQAKKNKEDFISTAMCVSQKSNDSVKHYGVSMSTCGPNAGKIMVAASCLSAWDDYVAGAVMTYYPEKSKKSYFDGTIQIPKDVRCQTFKLKNREEMKPCKSCSNMFGLNTDGDMFGLRRDAGETDRWPYGNCAEAESLSSLLKNETEEVKKQLLLRPNTCTPENRKRAREDVEKKLKEVLRMVKFEWDDKMMFYTPQKSTA